MVSIKFGINGLPELRRRLSKARRALDNFTPWLKQAALLAIESVQNNFDSGGRPTWNALDPGTVKRRKGGTGTGSPEPLRDTDVLMASISDPKDHTDGIYIMDNFAVEIGTNLKYAGPQHFGTGDGHIPARPFMFLQDEDEGKMVMFLEEYMDKALGPA